MTFLRFWYIRSVMKGTKGDINWADLRMTLNRIEMEIVQS